MAKKIRNVNHRLVIEPPHPGDFGLVHIGGITRDERETLCLLENMRDQIVRHVDDVRSRDIRIENDIEETCEFCGRPWTEGDSPHNRGCCHRDEEVMLAHEQGAK